MDGELYEDIVGQTARGWPPSYDTSIHVDCVGCQATAYTVCTKRSPLTGQVSSKRAPCIVRIAMGEGWAKSVTTN